MKKQIQQITILGYHVFGVDLRDDGEFDEIFTVEEGPADDKAAITAWYAERGYRLTTVAHEGVVTIDLDLREIYLKGRKPSADADQTAVVTSEKTKTPPASNPDAEAPAVPQAQDTARDAGVVVETEKKKYRGGASARLYEYIRNHPEQGVLKMIADATGGKLTEENVRDMVNGKAQCGRWFTVVGKALDELAAAEAARLAESALRSDPKTPFIYGRGAGLNGVDEAKLRRKVQAALVNYAAKHGQNLKPIVRATSNGVTEDTLRAILADCDAGRLQHVQVVDIALKKLALAETNGDSDNRSYDMA
jgi:hypothetical protein